MNIPELVATALNTGRPIEARRAAFAVLEKMGIEGLPITDDEKLRLVWEQLLTETPEQCAERHERKEAARIAKEDAEYRHCCDCYWRVPVEAAETCPKCTGNSWVKPSELSEDAARYGIYTGGTGDNAGDLRQVLLRGGTGGPDVERNRQDARIIVKIMMARGYAVPPPPYGWPQTFYLSEQDGPLPTPKVPASPGRWGAVYNPPSVEEIPCENYPSIHTAYDPGHSKSHPADPQAW